MHRRMIGVVVAILFGFAGCTTVQLDPIRQGGTTADVYYVNGHGIAVSTLSGSTVAVVASNPSEADVFTLYIRYLNTGEMRAEALPERIRVQAVTRRRERNIRVYSPDQYLALTRAVQTTGLIAQALAGIAGNASAGRIESASRGSFDLSDGTSGSFSSRTTSYDRSKKLEHQRETAEALARSIRRYQEQISDLDSRLLRRTTVFPGSSVDGEVVIDFRSAEYYRITILFGSDRHVFEFRVVENSVFW